MQNIKTEKETGKIEYVRATVRIPVVNEAGEVKRITTRTIWARILVVKDGVTLIKRVLPDGGATDQIELFLGRGTDIKLKRARLNTKYAELEIEE